LCHYARRWACLSSMLASDSPMVRVWKPKPTGKGTLTAPWNLRFQASFQPNKPSARLVAAVKKIGKVE
jgi:hypothetical protein